MIPNIDVFSLPHQIEYGKAEPKKFMCYGFNFNLTQQYADIDFGVFRIITTIVSEEPILSRRLPETEEDSINIITYNAIFKYEHNSLNYKDDTFISSVGCRKDPMLYQTRFERDVLISYLSHIPSGKLPGLTNIVWKYFQQDLYNTLKKYLRNYRLKQLFRTCKEPKEEVDDIVNDIQIAYKILGEELDISEENEDKI